MNGKPVSMFPVTASPTPAHISSGKIVFTRPISCLSSAPVEHAANALLVNEIAICIVVAWILAVIAQMLRQPLMLAYLVAGFTIGPVGLGFIQDEGSIETISELGLILLLFMIGLEIDLKKMWSAGRIIILTSVIQIIGCFGLAFLFFWANKFALKGGSLDILYLAVAIALSSTVIIVKVLYERRELDTLPGRITVGVLVLQDLVAILFLAIQPQLKDPSISVALLSLGKVLALVAIAFVASRYVLPPLFRTVARLPELVLVGALSWCFLLSGLASNLGLSREMGALIAGVGISTFPYTLDVTAKVTSLRDFFVTLFFVALGMKIPHPSGYFIGWAVAVSTFVFFSRFVTVFPTLYVMGQGHRASMLPFINLSQISELSLVIMSLGLAAGHIRAESMGLAAYSFALMAVLSSYAMGHSDSLLSTASRIFKRFHLRDLDDQTREFHPKNVPKIFLLGFSWTASSLLEEITRRRPEWLTQLAVLDFNPQVHHELKRRGIHAIYGDIGQRETLVHAGVDQADMIICTLPNTVLKGTNNLRMVQQLREINPTAQIIAHAELFADVPKLYDAGINYVSLPRVIEAVDLFEVIAAAKNKLLEQKTAELKKELKDRREVIP
jgi:Kef-type K+ transport system membrane component KefB